MSNGEVGESADREFNPGAWHDCAVWGLEWRNGGAEIGIDWASELEIRFDSILDCQRIDGIGHYRICPAKLVFMDVADLRVGLFWGESPGTFGWPLTPPLIHTIERTEADVKKPGPPFRWKILFEEAPAGEISFGASGFLETMLAEPLDLVNRYILTDDERTQLLDDADQQRRGGGR